VNFSRSFQSKLSFSHPVSQTLSKVTESIYEKSHESLQTTVDDVGDISWSLDCLSRIGA